MGGGSLSLFNFKPAGFADEEWRDVIGFENNYQVSNLGRIRSKERRSPSGQRLPSKLKSLSGTIYKTVNLWKDNVSYNKLVHRAVAEAFIPNPSNLPEVNHKDKDTTNNCVDNLEWVTASFNNAHKQANRDKTKPYRRQVKCLETGQIFDSISAAGRSVLSDATQIIESIQARRCCKGKTFVYADSIPDDPESYMKQAQALYEAFHPRPKMKNSKKVEIIESKEIFDSIAEASRYFNCDTATIVNRIESGRTVDGITLKYIE